VEVTPEVRITLNDMKVPLLAVKMCCYFKNSDYLQKILEAFSQFDKVEEAIEEDSSKFKLDPVISYDYLDGKRKLEIPNYEHIVSSFKG
jgi:ankyrin repeat protein